MTIVAQLEATSRIKREQITGGYVLDEDGVVHPMGKAKERKLRWLLPKLEPPVVVFCQFLHEIPIIRMILQERFSTVRELHGGIKDTPRVEARTDLIKDFQAGKVEAMVCQLRTGGVAIDLSRSSQLVFYSINHSFIDFEQIVFRVIGMNQKKTPHVWLLYIPETVDEEKIDLIQNKKYAAYKVVSSFERSE